MLPATTIYLVYLIVTVATGTGQIPIISLIMIGAVYGLQVSRPCRGSKARVLIATFTGYHLLTEAPMAVPWLAGHLYTSLPVSHISLANHVIDANECYSVYSFFLPLYAFWHFDDFSVCVQAAYLHATLTNSYLHSGEIPELSLVKARTRRFSPAMTIISMTP